MARSKEPEAHMSFSQLNEFLKCGEAYRRKRIEKEESPSNLAMTAGKAFHTGMETRFTFKMDGKYDGDSTAVSDAVDEAMGEDWAEAPIAALWPQPSEADYKRLQDSMADLSEHVFGQYKNMKVAAIEERFEIKLEGVELPIVGYIDLRTTQGTVIDWKTGAKAPAANSADVSEQLTLYDLATRKVHNVTPPRMGNIFARMGANGPLVKEFWTEPRKEADFERLTNRFQILDTALKNQGPWHPAPAGSWWCSEKQCVFWKDCKVRA